MQSNGIHTYLTGAGDSRPTVNLYGEDSRLVREVVGMKTAELDGSENV